MVVGFCWEPAHVGVAGNESTDELSKNALIDFNVPLSKVEIKTIIKENIIEEWQGN